MPVCGTSFWKKVSGLYETTYDSKEVVYVGAKGIVEMYLFVEFCVCLTSLVLVSVGSLCVWSHLTSQFQCAEAFFCKKGVVCYLENV